MQTIDAQLHYKAKTISTTNGLSDNRVTCFYKDRRGFMWIGTKNGLNRYDGHSFRIYRPAFGNSISNEVINDIEEDSQGRIWVATMGGLNILNQETGDWDVILPDPEKRMASLPNRIIWDISIDKEDKVWIVSDVFEFCSFDIKRKKITFYDWPAFASSEAKTKAVSYRSIQKAIPKSRHEWWLATTAGLVLFDTKSQAFNFIGGGYNSNILDIKYDSITGNVFLSCERGKVFRYQSHTKKYEEMKVEVISYPSQKYYERGKNEIWMASENGLLKVSDDRKKLQLERHIPELSGSLLPGGTINVYEDNNHIRWVATPNGASFYDFTDGLSSFLPLLSISDKEGANKMGGVYYDSVSHSYFVCALDPSAVFIIDTRTGAIRRITTDSKGNVLSICTRIKNDKNNDVWLLTGSHIYKYSRSSGTFNHFPAPNNGAEVIFRDMLQDEEGNYWFSSFNSGAYFYHTKQKKFLDFKDSTIKKYKSVTGIALPSPEPGVLIGTYGQGVIAYDNVNGEKKEYVETATAKDYFYLYLVNDIHSDSRGRAWLATHSGGLYRYNPGMPFEKAFTHFDMRHGLKSNNIISITSESDSVLWLLSDGGVVSINEEGKLLKSLEKDRFFSFSAYGSDSRYPHNIYFTHERNELLVGAGGGLFTYHPQSSASLVQFPMVITRVLVNDKVFSSEQMYDKKHQQLPFRKNTIQFEFAGLYFGNAATIQYEYKLDGYDTEWKNAGNNFSVRYQNLPSGSYRFYARAKDAQNNIAGEISGFSFRITPPFWRSWWFIVLMAIGMVIAIILIIRSLRQKLRIERVVNSFATSLYGHNNTEDIFWDTAKNCIRILGFVDCVIYQRDETRQNILLQRAAYGPKNPHRREIANPIEIKIGEGIVGTVAQTGEPIIIGNTAKDKRYIVDDARRLSEICMPVFIDNKVFAVIDSEHPQKNFYKPYHLQVLKKIAAICAERISKYLTEEKLRAKIARDLHDEMGSTLTSINIISKVAIEKQDGSIKVRDSFQKILDHTGNMMESMSDMVWAINPVNDSFGKLLLRMKEFAAEMLEPARINFYFDDSGLQREITLNPEQRKNIYLIFKETINNVVKYSQAKEVNIIFGLEASVLKMKIADNGIGFDVKSENTGNGIRNIQVRATEIKGFISLESIPGTGSSVTLQLHVT